MCRDPRRLEVSKEQVPQPEVQRNPVSQRFVLVSAVVASRRRLEKSLRLCPRSEEKNVHTLNQRKPRGLFVVKQQAPYSVIGPLTDAAHLQVVR